MSVKSRLPYSSREGLSGRYPGQNEQQVSIRVDPLQGDIDEEIHGLHAKVHQLKHVAQVIESETKYQNELINQLVLGKMFQPLKLIYNKVQLESTLLKAQAGVKNTMKRLNRRIIQNGSSHLTHVILFVLACVFFVVIWSKFFRSR